MNQTTFEFTHGVYYLKNSDLMPGDSFGEMALILSDNTRNATIKTEVPTVFASLDKGSFD